MNISTRPRTYTPEQSALMEKQVNKIIRQKNWEIVDIPLGLALAGSTPFYYNWYQKKREQYARDHFILRNAPNGVEPNPKPPQ